MGKARLLSGLKTETVATYCVCVRRCAEYARISGLPAGTRNSAWMPRVCHDGDRLTTYGRGLGYKPKGGVLLDIAGLWQTPCAAAFATYRS